MLNTTTPDIVGDVAAFHRKFNIPMAVRPVYDPEVVGFRLKFLREELTEMTAAHMEGDFVGIADALMDIIYVAMGGALSLGLPVKAMWDEVQRSNMDKVPATPSESWKHCRKPEGWVGPRIESCIVEAIGDNLQK